MEELIFGEVGRLLIPEHDDCSGFRACNIWEDVGRWELGLRVERRTGQQEIRAFATLGQGRQVLLDLFGEEGCLEGGTEHLGRGFNCEEEILLNSRNIVRLKRRNG